MQIFKKKFVAAVVATIVAGIGLAGSAGAVPNDQAVNLTPAQRQALQAEIDKHLKDYGDGKQIGINQIAWDNGQLTLTLALPGETWARAANEPAGVANCAFTHACLWSNTNFNGTGRDRLDRVNCDFITLQDPFTRSTASIHNNQTNGTQTIILNASRQILNANLAPSRINDTGVASRSLARFWQVC